VYTRNRDLYDRHLLAAKLEMQEITLQKISQELHDNIKNSLTVSRVHMQMLLEGTETGRQERVRSALELLENAIHEIKDIARSMNSDWIAGLGLPYALQKEIDKLKDTGLLDVETSFSTDRVALDAQKEVLIFRIAQESMSNIIKHAEAKKVLVSLQYNSDDVHLTISDDGKGFDYNATRNSSQGIGLQNLLARTMGLQASLTIQSAPGKGTTIDLSIPYTANQKPKKTAAGFNFFQRLMLLQAHPALIVINFFGFSLATFFLSEKQLVLALASLVLTFITRIVITWKMGFGNLAQKSLGRTMLVHAKPANVILRTIGLMVLFYGCWLDNYYVIAAGGILMVITLAMVPKKERNSLKPF
jgi:two-component sensor histidine kinase